MCENEVEKQALGKHTRNAMVCLPFHYLVEKFKPYIDVAYGTIFSQTCFVRFTLSTWFDLISGNGALLKKERHAQ